MEHTLSNINLKIQNELISLFKDFKFINKELSIFQGNIPNFILDDINLFVKECRKYSNHPYGFFKHMVNNIFNGENVSNIFVPFSLVNSSLFYSYLFFLGNEYVSRSNNIKKEIHLKRLQYGPHDTYDLWVNFTKKNLSSANHNHSGLISGIIFVSNPEKISTIFNNDFHYIGNPGEILLFPSETLHKVAGQNTDKERITLSFNLE